MRSAILVTVFICLNLGCKARVDAEVIPTAPAQVRPDARDGMAFHEQTSPLLRGTKLRDTLAELRDRAGKGDARAACQLATELDFCADADSRMRSLDAAAARLQAEFKGAVSSLSQATLDGFSETGAKQAQYCEGLAKISAEERIRNWRLAAMRGHLPSMLQYASGSSFGRNETLLVVDEFENVQGHRSQAHGASSRERESGGKPDVGESLRAPAMGA